MVLDKGEIAEMDSPAVLMADRNSVFSKMLADAENENNWTFNWIYWTKLLILNMW